MIPELSVRIVISNESPSSVFGWHKNTGEKCASFTGMWYLLPAPQLEHKIVFGVIWLGLFLLYSFAKSSFFPSLGKVNIQAIIGGR